MHQKGLFFGIQTQEWMYAAEKESAIYTCLLKKTISVHFEAR